MSFSQFYWLILLMYCIIWVEYLIVMDNTECIIIVILLIFIPTTTIILYIYTGEGFNLAFWQICGTPNLKVVNIVIIA